MKAENAVKGPVNAPLHFIKKLAIAVFALHVFPNGAGDGRFLFADMNEHVDLRTIPLAPRLKIRKKAAWGLAETPSSKRLSDYLGIKPSPGSACPCRRRWRTNGPGCRGYSRWFPASGRCPY